MDYPSDLWAEILSYVSDASDLLKIVLTGDHRTCRLRPLIRRLRFAFLPKVSTPTLESALSSSALYLNLEKILLEEKEDDDNGLKRMMFSPPTFEYSGVLFSRFPSHLHTLILNLSTQWIHPMHLSLLPRSLKRLEAPILFAHSQTAETTASVDSSSVSWPDLESLCFRGSLWKLLLTRQDLERLPTTLTHLDVRCAFLYDSCESCPLHRLANLTSLICAPEQRLGVWFPPNVVTLQLEFTTRASFFFKRIPRSVLHFTALSTQIGAQQPKCNALDLELLPRDLKTLKIHELVDWKDPASVKRALPPRLETYFGKCTLKGLDCLPSTITDFGAALIEDVEDEEEGEQSLSKIAPLSTLFPRLRKLSLASTTKCVLPSTFFDNLPFQSLVHINLGTQYKTTSKGFWNQLPRHLETLCCSVSQISLSLLSFTSLPPCLTCLELNISNLSIRDEHISSLPRRLRTLKLVGSGCELTDDCIPFLPRLLESLVLISNYNFTAESIPHWPRTLSYIQIGWNDKMDRAALRSIMVGSKTLVTLYRKLPP